MGKVGKGFDMGRVGKRLFVDKHPASPLLPSHHGWC
jgi:hypothetical protein